MIGALETGGPAHIVFTLFLKMGLEPMHVYLVVGRDNMQEALVIPMKLSEVKVPVTPGSCRCRPEPSYDNSETAELMC